MRDVDIERAVRAHLLEWSARADVLGTVDQRVRRRFGGATIDALAARAGALFGTDGDFIDGLKTRESFTIMAGVANCSLVTEEMGATTVAQEMSRFVDGAVRAFTDTEVRLPDQGVGTFASTIEVAELSAEMRRAVDDWSARSPLSAVRKRLEITVPEEEWSFEVKVIDADVEPTEMDLLFDDYRPSRRAVANEATLQRYFPRGTPAAWVSASDDGTAVMHLRVGAAMSIIEAWRTDAVRMNEVDVPLLGHEYVHTQRSLRIGSPLPFGRLFDEVVASDGARSATYFGEGQLLDVVSLPVGRSLRALALDHVIAGDTSGFYEQAAQLVGLTGLTLLSAHRPSNYCDAEVVPTPLGHSATRERAMVDAVLLHRLGHDGPTSVKAAVSENLARYLQKFPGQVENDLVDDHLGFRLPPVYQRVFSELKTDGRVQAPVAVTEAIGRLLDRAASR